MAVRAYSASVFFTNRLLSDSSPSTMRRKLSADRYQTVYNTAYSFLSKQFLDKVPEATLSSPAFKTDSGVFSHIFRGTRRDACDSWRSQLCVVVDVIAYVGHVVDAYGELAAQLESNRKFVGYPLKQVIYL